MRRADAPVKEVMPARALVQSATSARTAGACPRRVERRDGVDRRAPQAARQAARLEVEAVPADVLAQRSCRRPCLRATEKCVWMRGGGAIIQEGAIPEGGQAGRKNCARRAPRAPTSSSTARRASRSSSARQGTPFGNQKPSQPPDDVKQEPRRWTARAAAARPSTTRPRGAVASGPLRGLGRRFSPRERGGGAFVAALH